MSETVAIVGSRRGADLEAVKSFVHALYVKQPDTLLVSGGADGVDKTAEQTWLELGGKVKSFRTREFGPTKHAVEVWELGGDEPRVYVPAEEPTWYDREGALFYRDVLIAEESNRVVAFYRRGRSPGTQFTAGWARDTDTHLYEFESAA